MMGVELATIDEQRLNELVASQPARKRGAFGRALKEAAQYAKDMGHYRQAFMLSCKVIENEWHLGKAWGDVEKSLGGRPRKTGEKNHRFCASDLGCSKKRLHNALRLYQGFSLPQITEWAESQRDESSLKLARIHGAVTASKRRIHEKLVIDLPDGEYSVIVIDPPWPMEKIEREEAPTQTGFDYPTMDEDELAAMELPAADDCHLWMWTTHRFLPMALRLIPQWNFKYVCTFVWHKPGGFQPYGLPQYNCEFALYCRRGSPQFHMTKDFPACFSAPRGKHSEKPEQFYQMVNRVTRGNRIDMFNRRRIKGFDGWGNEAC